MKVSLLAAALLLGAPAFAGSIGTLTGINSTTITGGSQTVTIEGDYSSLERSVQSATTNPGATATASWSGSTSSNSSSNYSSNSSSNSSGNPTLTTSATGANTGANAASASLGTTTISGDYSSEVKNLFTGTQSGTSTGVFFNY